MQDHVNVRDKNVKNFSKKMSFFDVDKTFAEIWIIFARRRKMMECDASSDVNKQLLSPDSEASG